jgi:hypothetical protein
VSTDPACRKVQQFRQRWLWALLGGIAWSEIERYEPRTYRPLREFGGWGIRWTPGTLAYTVSGDRGVQLRLTTGRSVLVGSRHVEDFLGAIDEVYTN